MVQCHAWNNTNRYWIGRKVNQLLILMNEFTAIKLLWASIFIKKKIPWGCLTLVFPAADTLAHSPALYWQRSEDTIVPSLIYRRKLRVWVARLNHLEKEWFLWCDFMHLCASSLIINFGNAGGSGSPGCPWLRMPGKSGCLYSGVHRKNPLALETHDRVVLPNYVLYLSKNVSRENSHWEPHNLVALLQL